MLCEHYKDALIEAVATGVAPEGELRAHLTECAACRASFAQEQSLFAAIDSGVYAAANTQVPPSLLPRVRGSLEGAVVGRRWVQPLALASAGVAFALLVFLVARPPHRTPENAAGQGPVAATAAVTPTESAHPGKIPSPDAQVASVRRNRSHTAGNSTIPHSAASSSPEVLVPPSEREAFARFVATLNKHSGAAVDLLAHAPEKENVLVSDDQLQIPDIQIKPLEGTQEETSDGRSEKR